MRKIYFIIIIFTICSGITFAKDSLTPEQKKIISQIEFTVEPNQVEDLLKKFIFKIKNGKPGGGALTAFEYYGVSFKINEWINYNWFVADTGFSRKWLQQVNELIVYMTKMKKIIEASTFSGNTKNAKYLQAVQYYGVAYKRLLNLMEKPEKVSEKIQRKVQLQKALWQREMRKKYKLKQKY